MSVAIKMKIMSMITNMSTYDGDVDYVYGDDDDGGGDDGDGDGDRCIEKK